MMIPALCLTALLAAAPAQADGIKVAVVSIPEASEQYDRTRELEQQFEQLRLRFNGERNKRRQEIDMGNKALEETLRPGTEDFNNKRREVAMLEADLKWFVESEGSRLERLIASSLKSIFEDIQATTAEIAEEKGIDVVLAVDKLPEEVPDSSNLLRQQILLQKVLYASDRVDITDDVVKRLNENNKKRNNAAAAPGDSNK